MTEARGTAVITIDHATKRFGDFVAVDDVSITIERGEFFSMLGPSGCGKTTMLRLIAGFESLTSGRLAIDGRDMAAVPPYRRPVNTVFQNYALFPHLTVFENVAFGPRLKGLDGAALDRRVTGMLEVVRLADLAKRRPAQLSGGQRQRVALARALVNDPSALLLDEPLSALDLELRRQMQLELKRIQREVGITFVFVTHDQEEALTMSDRIAVMRAGRLEQLGHPEEIYDAPSTPFVARFIGIANLLPARVERGGEPLTVRLDSDAVLRVTAGAHAFAPGARVLCMVRPERVNLYPGGLPPGVDGLPVTVATLAFQGPVLRYGLRDASGGEIVAHVESEDRDTSIRVGDRVWAGWDPGAARLLPPEA
ncbi:MAG TPA: ABC transporter ATP-binding protein [Candidatus Limnocylindria bacterium]|nr:ABC transporter ATP-binding protein [Candidatus Limnocylindria bacterium]